jgi:hypothetical protein
MTGRAPRLDIDPARFRLQRRGGPPSFLSGLASTVAVDASVPGGPGTIEVGFAPALAERAGLALPYGVSAREPAFLRVTYEAPEHGGRGYVIHAEYLHSPPHNPTTRPLWRQAARPRWLRAIQPLPGEPP